MKKITRTFFDCLILLFCLGCQPESEKNRDFEKKLLIGTWHLNEWDLYRNIYFQDSIHVVFDNHIDTLFYFEYELKNDTLLLYREHGQLLSANTIIKLDKDSLVFANLLDKEGVQRYSRKERKE